MNTMNIILFPHSFYIFHIYNIICQFILGKERKTTQISPEIQQKLAFEFDLTQVGNNGQLLVLFMYNTVNEMYLLRIHPEVPLVDITHGTNKEKKELFTIAAKD